MLPEAMRENQIDMWIVAMKEGHYDPLWELFGRGYVGTIGYYIFTDRGGDRIERAAIGITDHNRDACGAYDIDSTVALGAFVAERKPRRIGLNMSEEMGLADGLSHTLYNHIVKEVGAQYATRLVSAEKMVSAFSSRRVASELVAFGAATEIGRQIAERALSKEVITPGVTTSPGGFRTNSCDAGSARRSRCLRSTSPGLTGSRQRRTTGSSSVAIC